MAEGTKPPDLPSIAISSSSHPRQVAAAAIPSHSSSSSSPLTTNLIPSIPKLPLENPTPTLHNPTSPNKCQFPSPPKKTQIPSLIVEEFPPLLPSHIENTQISNLVPIEQSNTSEFWASLFKSKPLSAGSEELEIYEPNLVNEALEIDEETLEEGAKEWEDNVRVYIDIDDSKPLPNSLPIKFKSEKVIEVEFEYIWKPLICSSCKSFDHLPSVCGNASKKPTPRIYPNFRKTTPTSWRQVEVQRKEALVIGEKQATKRVQVCTGSKDQPKESNRFAPLGSGDDSSLFGDEEDEDVGTQEQQVEESERLINEEGNVEDMVLEFLPQGIIDVVDSPLLLEKIHNVKEVSPSSHQVNEEDSHIENEARLEVGNGKNINEEENVVEDRNDLEEGEWITPNYNTKSPPNTRFKCAKVPSTFIKKRAKQKKTNQELDEIDAIDVPDGVSPQRARATKEAIHVSSLLKAMEIKNLKTMSKRVDSEQYYVTFEMFVADVKRMFANARTYNSPDTIYYKCASRLENYFSLKVQSSIQTSNKVQP